MTKFGELISTEKPVLIDFYADRDTSAAEFNTLRNVAATLGDRAKVIKIDVKKNEMLAEALRVRGNSTFMIYKDGEIKWRETGNQDIETLVTNVSKYFN